MKTTEEILDILQDGFFGDGGTHATGVDKLAQVLKTAKPKPADQKAPFADVPGELKQLPQWVTWRHDPDAGKVPCQADGSNAKTNDPSTWTTFDAALAAYLANPGKFAGIGFCFADGGEYTGVDLDGCLVVGEVAEWARPYLDRFKGAYAEISPSGNGVKIWCRGEFGGSGGKRNLDGQAHVGVEIYCKGRFFAVTGDVLESPAGAIPKLQSAVNETRAWVKTRPEKPKDPSATNGHATNGQADAWKMKAPTNGRPDAATRARACIMSGKHPDAIEGQSGHDVIYSAACALIDGFGLDRGTSRPILWDFNLAKAVPPESEYQIDHKLDDAIKNHPTPSLRLLNVDRGPPNGKATSTTTTVATEPEPDLEDIEIIDRWPVLDPNVFYGVAGQVAILADPHTESSMVATLVQFLAAFGCMIDRTAYFPIGATRHYLKIYPALVGGTGVGRKGTSWDFVRWILSQIDPVWEGARIQSGLVSGEGLAHHVRDERREDQEIRDKKTGVVIRTDNVLVDAGVKDKRLLVVETEMSRMLKAAGRDSNTLSDVVRQAWEMDWLRTLGKQNPTYATGAHVSIIAHTNPADVRKYLTETDSANGFANRFLWVLTRRSKSLPDGGEIFSVDWNPVVERIREAAEAVRARGMFRITRDAEASAVWRKLYPKLTEDRGPNGYYLDRAAPYVLRLACLYAVLDGSDVIRVEHLTAAVCLWDYCEESAKQIFGIKKDPNEVKLLDALEKAPKGLTRKEISVEVFQRHAKAKVIASLLGDMLTRGLIRRETDAATGGRPAERWFKGKAEGVS